MIKCTRCGCYQNEYGINCISYSGNSNADLYFLGEMAGRNEAQASRIKPTHFVGKAGNILNYLLDLAGINRADVAIANSLRCYKANNGKPTGKELEACFIHTYNEIKKIKPKLVVLLGEHALRLALGVESISAYRGKILWSEKLQCNVMPTFHPMAAGYDYARRELVESDFKQLKQAVNLPEKKLKLYDYIFFESKDDHRIELALDEINEAKAIAFDIEAYGGDPFKDRLRLLQIGIGKGPVYVFDASIVNYLKSFFKNIFSTKPVIGQTFEFDCKWLYVNTGIYIKNWYFDTCLAEFMLTGMKDNDLTSLVAKYADESLGYDTYVKSLGGAHKVKNVHDLLQYAACDVGVLFKIMRKQIRLLVQEKMWWYFTNIMMPCNNVLTQMSLRGVLYDKDRLLEVDKVYEIKSKKLLEQAVQVDGIDEAERFFGQKFNPKSPAHIKYLLLHYYALPVLKQTKKKNPSIGKDEMKKYATAPYNNEYCTIMEEYRGIEAMRGNFLSGVLPKLHNSTAHTTYSLHSVATSRPNSKNPNILNLPAKSADKDIKSCIISRPGYTFLYMDFSQIEIRVASIIFYDKNLIAACNTKGEDFHSNIASKIYNIPLDKFIAGKKAGNNAILDKRKAAKNVSFGILYQMSPIALAYRIGVSEDKAEVFIKDYFSQFPGVEKGIEDTKKFFIDNGYVSSYFGFKRFWPSHTEEDHAYIREAVNMPIQSTAWQLVQLAMIKLAKEFGEFEESVNSNGLVMQVYDAIVCEVLDEYVPYWAEKMTKIATTINKPFPKLNEVILKVDLESGKNLRDLSRLELI